MTYSELVDLDVEFDEIDTVVNSSSKTYFSINPENWEILKRTINYEEPENE